MAGRNKGSRVSHPYLPSRQCQHSPYGHGTWVSRIQCHSQYYLIFVPVILDKSPSLEEILWNFRCLKDKKQRLTLMDNPHFYAELPTSPEAYGDSLIIYPTEDFRHVDKFYVLTASDKTMPVHIMTDRDLQVFDNFWCPQNAIIFKGLDLLLSPTHFLMSCQTSVGGSGGKASLRHPSKARTVSFASGSRCRPFPGLQATHSPNFVSVS
jgi:hypothetical protein